MNAESQNKLCVSCMFGFIVLLAIIIVGWLRWPAPKPQVEDPHQITLRYNEQGKLEFKDYQGNLLVPTALDKDNAIRALFQGRTIESVDALTVFNVKLHNPKCSPMITNGNGCVAPHTYCCNL